jgi:uncharacterized protein YbaR (Trm112 family)
MADVLTELAALLRCPITGQQLHLATPEEFRSLASHDADGFLVREDGTAAYPVEKGIPSLLPESAIGLAPADRKPAS